VNSSASGLTDDTLLGGRVRFTQPARGYRAGLDALLLAASVPAHDPGRPAEALDLGCGAGAVMLCARARLGSGWQWTGLEREPDLAALANANAVANGFADTVQAHTGDAAQLPVDWQNRFALVVSNPPYYEPGTISAPAEGREGAWLADIGLKGWLNAMLHACAPRGRVLLVHRAADLARILAPLERQAGEISVLPLHSAADEPASRVLISARKGLRPGPLRLHTGRILHAGGGESDWLSALTRDAAPLPFA
jgi:tRNA1(Val) A37 N6-methylase TrmN6